MRINYFVVLILVLANLGFAISCVNLSNNLTRYGNYSGSYPDCESSPSSPPDCSLLDDCSGHGSCIADNTCSCDSGWEGDPSCSTATCSDLNSCSGHGSCDSGSDTCSCDLGWDGDPSCSTATCSDLNSCSGHGSCDSGSDTCSCDSGWEGDPSCSTATCSDLNSCSGHGSCDSGSDTCSCDLGWDGDPSCGTATCSDNNYCSGEGTCDTSTDTCDCNPGWEGDSACSTATCSDNNYCSSHGSCDSGSDTCSCSAGWTGDSCDTPTLSGCVDLTNPSTYGTNITGNMSTGFNVTGSITLCNDSYPFSGVTALTVIEANVTIDCAGSSIIGDGTPDTYGVYTDQSNTTVENCSISTFDKDVYFNDATGGAILGNDLSLAQYGSSDWPYALGVYINGSTGINISLNKVHDNNDFGIYLDQGSDYNSITYNNMTDNGQGMYLYYADDNQIGYNYMSGQFVSYGSCPFLYLKNGSDYSYYTDLGGEPLGTAWFRPQKYTSGMYELGDFQPTNGTYDLKVREVIPESDYFDLAKLALVDVPTGYGVLNTWSYTYPFNQAPTENFMTIQDPIAPISATDNYGNDVLPQVSAKDGVPVPIYDKVQNPITLDFGPIANPQYAKLIITGWAAYDVNAALKPQNYLLVQTQAPNGTWITRESFGSFIGDSKTIVFNVSGILQPDDAKVRIIAPSSSSTIHLIDQVLLDDSAPVPFNVTYVDPSTATLQWGGSTNYVYATIDHRHVNVTDDHNANIPDDLMYGNFTKYGDVLPLLASADDKFVVMRSGDELHLQFNDIARADGTDRYAFLLADDMYTIKSSINGFVRDSIDPMPFHGMSSYPYNGSYANESERQSYRSEWNTRDYAEPAPNSTEVDLPYSYNNTVFDNTIIGGYPYSSGINLQDENSTSILYNNISSVETGIYSDYSVSTQIIGNNITAGNSGTGIDLYGENDGYPTDSVISNNSILSDNVGIQLDGSSTNTLVFGNIMNTSGTSIYLTDGSAGNTILRNNITSGSWVDDEVSGNYYSDATSGNIYYEPDGTPSWEEYDIADANGDGWADIGSNLPFSASLSGGEWIGSGQDWHPYTTNTASCVNLTDPSTYQNDVQGDMADGFSVNSSILLCTDNYSFDGDIIALAVTNPGVIIDCNGAEIIGENGSRNLGVLSDQPGTMITDCDIMNFSTGIMLNQTAYDSTVSWDNISSTNAAGFGEDEFSIPCGIASFSSYGTIRADDINTIVSGILFYSDSNNTASDDDLNSTFPLILFGSAQDNVSGVDAASIDQFGIGESAGLYMIEGYDNDFSGNTFNATEGPAIIAAESESNTFLGNTMQGLAWVYDDYGDNTYNDSTSGNIYYLVDGTPAWEVYDIADTNHDGWADVGSDVPFSSTTQPGIDGYWPYAGADYHPYTPNSCVDLTDNSTYQNKVQGSMGSGFTVNGSIVLCPATYGFSGVSALTVTQPDVAVDCAGSSLVSTSDSNTSVYSNQPNTTIESCNVSGFDTGIDIESGGDYAAIQNDAVNASSDAIYLDSVTGAIVSDSNANSSSESAIELYGTTDSDVTGSQATSKEGVGILVHNYANQNVIENDTATYLGDDCSYEICGAIFIGSSTDNIVDNNTVLSINGHGIRVGAGNDNSNDNNITNNNVNSTSGVGITLNSGASYDLIANNTVDANSVDSCPYTECGGIFFASNANGNIIEGNNITSHYWYGARLSGSSGNAFH